MSVFPVDNNTMIDVESTIKNVVVYSDRAQLSRHVKVSLVKGEQTFFFKGLPPEIDRDLIQVQIQGTGAAASVLLKCVEHVSKMDTKDTSADREESAAAIKVVQSKLNAITDEITCAQQTIENYNSILDRAAYPNCEEDATRLEPSSWDPVTDMVWDSIEKKNKQLRGLRRRRDALGKEISVLQENAHRLGSSESRVEGVAVTLVAADAVVLTLVLQYVVHGASWYPQYDVHVDAVKREFALTYTGVVKQTTSETWTDVAVELSTAKPQIGGEAPKLTPWRIHQIVPIYHTYNNNNNNNGPSRHRREQMSQMMNAYAPEVDDGDDGTDSSSLMNALEERGVVRHEAAAVSTKATAVFFSIAGRHTVKSDGTEHKVTVMQQSFPGHFRYSCVPKLTTHAYLKAKAINTTECPLLPGSANIFLDNNFISTSTLELVPPGGEFWVFLGVDDSVHVTHKSLQQHRSNTGGGVFCNKKRRATYAFEITIRNGKKTTEEVVVWDQIPIAEDSKIHVEVLDAYGKGTDNMKINDVNYVEWFLNLRPGAEQKIPFSYAVDWPHEEDITGL
eukprot:PhM_4_TR5632/c0_g1_i1/m.7775